MTALLPPSDLRLLRLAASAAASAARFAVLPERAVRRRQRLQVCAAARALTALGVRVRVVCSPVPWPRTGGRLVLGGDVGRLGELALLTAVPRSVDGWSALAGRAFTGRPAHPAPAAVTGDDGVPCPATVLYRTADGPLDRPPRSLAEALALRGLVVEVYLLAPPDRLPVRRPLVPAPRRRPDLEQLDDLAA